MVEVAYDYVTTVLESKHKRGMVGLHGNLCPLSVL